MHARLNQADHQDMAMIPLAPWRMTMAGFCAALVGIGLARFAYTPLVPALVNAHWFGASATAYLGAANLAGYLAGALLGRPATGRVATPVLLRAMMALATAAFFGCAYPLSFSWFFGWRFLSGLSGGALMVLAAPSILPLVPPSRRGLAGGIIFMGVGIGIIASGTLVPLLLRQGLTSTWLGLGLLAAVLTGLAWGGWPPETAPSRIEDDNPAPPPSSRQNALYLEYGLNAVGLVPHMIFLVDFVARGLGRGLDSGAGYWVWLGLGATAGPILTGLLGDWLGFRQALRWGFLIQALAVALPVWSDQPLGLTLSSLIIGAFIPGIVTLVLGRLQEIRPNQPAAQKSAWSAATTCFALLQAAAAYGMSFLFAHNGGDYQILFLIGSGALMLALSIDFFAKADD